LELYPDKNKVYGDGGVRFLFEGRLLGEVKSSFELSDDNFIHSRKSQ
jgi:hypothetical protein